MDVSFRGGSFADAPICNNNQNKRKLPQEVGSVSVDVCLAV